MNDQKKISLFPEIGKTVSRGEKIKLHATGLLNPDDTVISWVRLNPFVRDGVLTELQAKQLMTIEINTPTNIPRGDILKRLTNYIAKGGLQDVRRKVEKRLARKETA